MPRIIVLLSGRDVFCELTPRLDGWLLRCDLAEWELCRLSEGELVEFDTPDRRGMRVVIDKVVAHPAGEPVVYVELGAYVPPPVPELDEPAGLRKRRRKTPVV